MPGYVIEREACRWVLSAWRDTPTSPVSTLLEQNGRRSDILDVKVFEN